MLEFVKYYNVKWRSDIEVYFLYFSVCEKFGLQIIKLNSLIIILKHCFSFWNIHAYFLSLYQFIEHTKIHQLPQDF